jgi:ribosome-associated toxin RatA of RatAB toxin-antitoxin module
MRTVLDELEVAAVATRLPATAETTRIALTSTGPRGRGNHLDLPAFATDPRLDPSLPNTLRHRIDRFSAVAILAVSTALAALAPDERPARDRIGVFLANTRAGWSYGEPELDLLVHKGPQAMHAYQATAWFPAAAQGEVTIALDLRGCAKTTAGRESGFAEAIWLARDALERGAVDLAVVGAAESLANGFVLRDWTDDEPLPTTGPAEGAVVFALRRPTTPTTRLGTIRLGDLRHRPHRTATRDACWVPTLAAAGRLHDAVTDRATPFDRTAIAVGGGYWITVERPGHRARSRIPENDRTGAPMTTVLSQTTHTGDLSATARHELSIHGRAPEVFEMTRDVLRWTEYMPAVTAAAFVEQTENGDVVEITAEANDQKHTWRSRRAIDATARTIDFTRIDPTEPLRAMRGRWEFTADGDTTRAVLTHQWSTTTPAARDFYAAATRSNATRDLEGLAEHFVRVAR